ncbi:MAG TPA: hypothetical protein P5169_09715, partial [Kiritimatiellia bacterium]|nr:hypothetical protein [Kiritimatiellia bacterium]
YQLMTHGKDYDFRWLEERLRPLNFRLIYCVRSPESFAAARAIRLQVSGKPDQYDDLSLFIREQEVLDRLVAESILPVLRLDMSDNNVSAAADRVADWLEATGGLWMEN